MMLVFCIILSVIGMAVSYPIHRQGCQPTPNQAFASKATFFQPSNKQPSTSVFYRDEDESTFDAMNIGIQKSPNNKNVVDKKKNSTSSDFQNRMKNTLVQRKKKRSTLLRRSDDTTRYQPTNVKIVTSLEEFANVIEQGRRDDKVVVAQFYADWCQKCHTLRPSFARAANSHPQVIFVNVPVLNTNSNLHQGLGVKSVPFGHIYHPENGLVEETKLSRKMFSEFEGLVKMHSN
mmetsp:Transcript_20610/g.37026  ORF Transcript_20610/g.37026 Transcript_20610/m.37026 type:complete len:233 (-) Transcript_20610:142-840(-)|eukprot:CAMPEP_0201633584 /NCGR_PEP_ID=MMETSP0493-20130528/6848_1 /ASSEMBLY_ACC=CAM_ASM_000838 /TAXON_ID=420259 /ORGANISM="Thalassiosira gravida, Strain GMp14c1" /LENGTH=232 /DNA_ID=CAMNT_0048105317 /DNA_START=138 /DNA_END=836 /DNA_ORIENTATION=-